MQHCQYNVVEVNTYFTNCLYNCLAGCTVVAGINFNSSNEIRLPSNTSNYIRDGLVTHIPGFICSDADMFVREETF